MTTLKSLTLDNGLQVDFIDRSNRYFGDYHRVLIDVRISYTLPQDDEDSGQFWSEARKLLGAKLTLNRTLERMAVPTADIDRVREQLVEDFLCHSGDYLGRPDYLRSQAEVALKRRSTGRRYTP